jgi:S1-C subfamily serine protease
MRQMLIPVFLVLLSLTGVSCSSAQSHEGPGSRSVTADGHDTTAAWLGVSIQNMTSHAAKELRTTTDKGVLIVDVVEDSPAENAGLREDDIIVAVDGKAVTDASDLHDRIRAMRPGQSVKLSVIRDDQQKEFTAVLAELPDEAERFGVIPIPPVPPPRMFFTSGGTYGLRLMELNDQLGEFFGAPDHRGVLVEEVRAGSPAEKAGFMAGDVITQIGKERIEDVEDVRSALWDFKDGDSARVEIIRKLSHLTLTLAVTKPDGKGYEYRWRRHAPFWHGGTFEWNSREFNQQMREFGKKMEKVGKELEQRLKGIGEKIKIQMRRMDI